YPEREFVSVPARRSYCEPARPFLPAGATAPPLTAQQEHDDVLDAADVLGKRLVTTRLHHAVTLRQENATAALEVMSRFAADPRWLIYLPPTMSPSETTTEPGLLEHPAEAFAYYRNQGVPRVVCEEKHMGSRAVAVVCADADAARKRFGVTTGETGIVCTRTGRRFFTDPATERALLSRLSAALGAAGIWEQLRAGGAGRGGALRRGRGRAQELRRAQPAAGGAAGPATRGAAVAARDQPPPRSPKDPRGAAPVFLDPPRPRREDV